MRVCGYCTFDNREGLLFCENCGRPLGQTPEVTLPTRPFDLTGEGLNSRSTWGTTQFQADSQIILHIRDSSQPIVLIPKKRLVLGRRDSNGTEPDLDFTPYGALEKGISRVHAVIDRTDETLTLLDMGSSNGTQLNGQRLIPEQPRILRDGDEIRLGKLIAHIYFK